MGAEVDIVPSRMNTCAVVVTFHPDPGIVELFAILVMQVHYVVVVDNHSNPVELRILRDLCTAMGITLIENPCNRGIAAAINQGIRFASKVEIVKWVLLFDQDSRPFATFMQEMAVLYQFYPTPHKIGLLSPNLVESGTGKPRYADSAQGAELWAERDYVITSGSLVSLAAVQACGGMRAEFFIDQVDREFCFRLQAHGFRIVGTPIPLMVHSIGRVEIHSLLGRVLVSTNHSAARQYYISRNQTVLMKEQFLERPRWVLDLALRRVLNALVICLFEEDRFTKLRMIARGLVDGLRSDFSYSPLQRVA